MNNIISFVGYAGSGKDTCLELVQRNIADPVHKFANADALKKITAILFGLDYTRMNDLNYKTYTKVSLNNKDYSVRELLQSVGQELKILYGNNLWNNIVNRSIIEFVTSTDFKPTTLIIKTDDRFPFEVESSKSLGAIVVWVDRLSAPGRNMKHISETILEETKLLCDYTIDNNGSLKDLEVNIRVLLENIKLS